MNPKKAKYNRPERPINFVKVKEVATAFGVVPITIHRWIKSGRLPEPIRMTKKTVGWRPNIIKPFLP